MAKLAIVFEENVAEAAVQWLEQKLISAHLKVDRDVLLMGAACLVVSYYSLLFILNYLRIYKIINLKYNDDDKYRYISTLIVQTTAPTWLLSVEAEHCNLMKKCQETG